MAKKINDVDIIQQDSTLQIEANVSTIDYEDKWLRAEAELENYKKRAELDQQATEIRVLKHVLYAVLPTFDSFNQGLKQDITEREQNALNILKTQFLSNLSLINVQLVQYEMFDPSIHEVIVTVQDITKPDNTIIEIYQDGFIHRGKIIRPAQVSLNKL